MTYFLLYYILEKIFLRNIGEDTYEKTSGDFRIPLHSELKCLVIFKKYQQFDWLTWKTKNIKTEQH